ncbi:hypothetical protein EVAR_42905_1 [Eumeta japonica]|uniref:Uncharacterized protein n=1 Tax=Eumeta variegata TaxID=151549 RepID=A0A4C1WXG0_EUMVA|nr:hypothetical protein EVAR_42905_1 [Eumeta japonica]
MDEYPYFNWVEPGRFPEAFDPDVHFVYDWTILMIFKYRLLQKSHALVNFARALKWVTSTGEIPHTVYRQEVTASSVAFRPLSESFGGPLSPSSVHSPFIRYPIPAQEAGDAPVTPLGCGVSMMIGLRVERRIELSSQSSLCTSASLVERAS